MRVRVLIENKETPFFLAEHGLSLLIEINNKKILFDTGKSNSFLDNAKKLNLDLSNINFICLSHAHYDHTTGLMEYINKYNYNNPIYVGEGFNNNKYEILDDKSGYKYIGTPFTNNDLSNLVFVNDNLKIDDDIILLTNFKLENDYEDVHPKLFKLENNNYVKDTFNDELVLAINTPKGYVLIVGCAHTGICNIITQAKKRLNGKIRGVIGGFHLYKADNIYVDKVVEELNKLNVEFVLPMHCTRRDKEFKEAFKERCFIKETGDLFIIDEAIKKNVKFTNTKLADEYAKHTTRNIREGDRN